MPPPSQTVERTQQQFLAGLVARLRALPPDQLAAVLAEVVLPPVRVTEHLSPLERR